MRVVRFPRGGLIAAVILSLAACSVGASPTSPPPVTPSAPAAPPTATPTPAPTRAAPTPTPAPTPAAGLVTTLEGVRLATIQIEATGTFVDPQDGQRNNAAGRGSGFFIDRNGLALTNNHVVTGAAYLKVWIGGETGQTYNARVLGASECSDLALIQVDNVTDGAWLAFYEEKVEPGLEVYGAGYPLGDPQYTLKKGIVSKSRANGDTDWASIDYVIEHDAATLPGNSGGPLVTRDGQVVGVNYASDQAGERFAVADAEVARILPDLKAGKDVTSIGVNGVALNDTATGVSGIWVSSVKSGSPADSAGVKAGDVITRLEGLILSSDGTMGDYCRVLRSHGTNAPLAIQVLRTSTSQVLEGQLNGTRTLAPVAALNTNPNETPQPEPTTAPEPSAGPEPSGGPEPTPAADDYPAYQVVIDQSGTIQTEVPSAWTDIRNGNWTRDGNVIGVGINASTDVEKWIKGWDTPGIFLGASKLLADQGIASLLADAAKPAETDCTLIGEQTYDANGFKGTYRSYEKCGEAGTFDLILVAAPPSGAYIIEVQVIALEDRDVTAANHALRLLDVLKEVK